MTTEVVEGIRVLKMYGWEIEYAKRIGEIRKKEMLMHRWRGVMRASNMSLFVSA